MHVDGQWRGRPASVWSLAILDLGAATLCTVGALLPPTPRSPAGLNAIAAVAAVSMASALWWLSPRGRERLVHLNVVLHLLGTTVLVAEAARGAGALAAAFSYLLITLYVAAFTSRRVARGYVAAAVVLLVAAVAVNDVVPTSLAVLLPPVLACVTAGEVLSWLTGYLRALIVTDPLTGLANRAGFVAAAERQIALAARTGAPATLVVVDLDRFKLVNDHGGHAAGDRLLRDLAAAWRTQLRLGDVACRTGGDEFALLLPGTDTADAHAVLERLRGASASAWSAGVATLAPGEDLDRWMARADEALYRVKRERPVATR